MRRRRQIIFGVLVILAGVVLLLANLYEIELGAIVWPLIIIMLGIWLMVAPKRLAPDTVLTQKILAEIERDGAWQVQNEAVWSFITDMDLDFTQAILPPGETHLRTAGFVGDIELTVPQDVGLEVSSSAVVSSLNMAGHKEERLLTPLHIKTENYDSADRRIHLESTHFVGEIKVRRLPVAA